MPHRIFRNWLPDGGNELPAEPHREKLRQLAAAARTFADAGFTPTASSLERTISRGRSFIELIGQGADGRDAAERLVRIECRGAVVREQLDQSLPRIRSRIAG